MDDSIRRTSLFLLLLLVLLALLTGYWQAVRGPALVARDDNPRKVLAQRQIPRGPILDRNGHLLASSAYTADGYVRAYPEPAAAPIVGYYSLRYGAGGIEAAFNDELEGTAGLSSWDSWGDGLLHRVPPGQPVRLTLDIGVQRAADTALGNHKGAVVVLSVPDSQVIALASHPTFNPTTLDEDWDRLRADPSLSLLNRATQSAYQPGAAFQTIALAAALSRDLVHLTDTVPLANQPVTVDSVALQCAVQPAAGTLAAAYAAGCPAPFNTLAKQLDAAGLTEAIHRWGLDIAPASFELPVHPAVFTPTLLTTTQAVRELVLGQGSLTVSPLQMATVAGIVANSGHPVATPHLTLEAVPSFPASSTPLFETQVAHSLLAALAVRGDVASQMASAASGQNTLTWFTGLAPVDSPKWVIVVLIENGDATVTYQVADQVRSALGP